MRTGLVFLAALLLVGSASAGEPCKAVRDMSEFVSTRSVPLPAARFAGIKSDMSVGEILKRLGPAARDLGSGLFILEWDVTDGRVFRVSASSLCDLPRGFGFGPKKAESK